MLHEDKIHHSNPTTKPGPSVMLNNKLLLLLYFVCEKKMLLTRRYVCARFNILINLIKRENE